MSHTIEAAGAGSKRTRVDRDEKSVAFVCGDETNTLHFAGDETNTLQFYSRSKDLLARELSNFAVLQVPFAWNGSTWLSVEEAYQWSFATLLAETIPNEVAALQFAAHLREVANAAHFASENDLQSVALSVAAKKYNTKGRLQSLAEEHGFSSKAKASAAYDAAKKTFHTRNADLMRVLLEARFAQDPRSQRLLLATGSRPLEHFEKSTRTKTPYWGVSGGRGTNALGILLEKIRLHYLAKRS